MKTKEDSFSVLSKFLTWGIIGLVFTSLPAACSSDDEGPDYGIPVAVQFTAGNISVLRTTANGNQWTHGDQIGIFMIANEARSIDGNIKENAGNIPYQAESGNSDESSFIPVGATIYYPVDGSKVDFIAYHPQNSSINNYVYPIGLSDQSKLPAIDLMTAKANGTAGAGYDKTNTSAVDLLFYHRLAKGLLIIQPGEGVNRDDLEAADNLEVKLKGINTTAVLDMSGTGIISNEADIEDIDIPINEEDSKLRRAAILLPVILGVDHVVEFTLKNTNTTYTWIMKDNVVSGSSPITGLEAGKKYTFTVTLKKNQMNVWGTIEKCGNGGQANGTAQ